MSAVEAPADMRQSIIDEEHLRLLSLGHYITGGLCVLFASMFIIHFVMLVVMASDPNFFPPPKPGQPGPPDGAFRIFGIVIGVFILLGWTFGGLTIYVGRCIKRRGRRSLSLVMACLNLLFIPVGTILGVASIMVLTRPSVKRAYEAQGQVEAGHPR